jgi:pyruvate ferredoxin oxidoreductase alpha subunit
MGARDNGWIQIHCENSQEVYDASLSAWRIAEHPDVLLPVMVCLDGFTLSHTMENVYTLPDDAVKEFVGKREFITVKGHKGETELRLNPDVPLSFGPVDLQDYYFEHKLHQIEAMKHALKVIPEIDAEYAHISGRSYDFLHPYRMEDAEVAILGLGSAMGTVRFAVDQLRDEGVKAGLIKMRVYRPFPSAELIESLSRIPAVGILDKSLSLGAPGGPLYEEVKASLYHLGEKPHIANYIHGLGGRDTSPHHIRGIYESLLDIKEKGEVTEAVNYVGARH